jgi:hypothetical protein
MDQSKPPSQSDDLWFQKSNYPANWLSKKSNEIIKKIKQKNMKNLIFILLLLPLISFGQLNYEKALTFQNNIRSFYNLNELKYNDSLAYSAKEWAEYLSETSKFEFSDDDNGELIYIYEKKTGLEINNYLLDASVGWAIQYNGEEETFKQIICENCEYIGFGFAQNKDYIYVVAKYNKIYK